jgi:hypothetical protein
MDAIRARILTRLVPDDDWLDPERPVELDRLFDQFVHEEDSESGKFQFLKIAVVMLVLLALAAAWRCTPLSQWVKLETLTTLAGYLKDSPLLPFGVIGAYVVGGLIMVPVTALIGATAIIFPAHLGVIYALAGCLLNSLTTYLAGVGRKTLRCLPTAFWLPSKTRIGPTLPSPPVSPSFWRWAAG